MLASNPEMVQITPCSVNFRRDAFTENQLTKLSPFIGDFIAGDQSLFMATYYMYFLFLTSEVKCGGAALDIADRQNAHGMTLAVITGHHVQYYRHPIHTFDFTALDGKDKWTAYQFTKNATGLSQDLGNLMQSDASCASMSDERGSRSSNAGQQEVTPGTSFSEPKRRKG
ncbi:hypothetical protein C8A05DRAFT_48424 [Staphylotrichum tortipilum]|uniref:DUF7924 domain-containing protein n=1 Tax=Staphylotrichum tortipilum TaxID=2831512 RepID=A0AAN6MAS6_9PEZI|nr:hypothetical protein C8A05DRAFT_48424 [Staphylotrichum longicolle]